MDFLFIVGCHLSGKTLLARLFDGHPDCLSIEGETQVFHKFDHVRRFADLEQRFLHMVGRPYDFARARKESFDSSIERSRNWQKHLYWQVIEDRGAGPRAEQRLKNVLRKGEAGDVFREICAIYAEAAGKGEALRYCIEDTPHNEFRCEEILRFLPSAKFIHIIRDPFDALAARIGHKVAQIRDRELIELGLTWRASLYKGGALSAKYPDHYRIIRFENLVTHTSRVMEELCRFLDIDFEESLTRPKVTGNREARNGGVQDAYGEVMDRRVLTSDAAEVLKVSEMALLASLWRRDYVSLDYGKYARQINEGRLVRFLGKASLRQIALFLKCGFERSRLGPAFADIAKTQYRK